MKNILFLKITADYDPLYESILEVSKLFDYNLTKYDFEGFDALHEFLSQSEGSIFDVIYVAAHSNEDLLSDSCDGKNTLSWLNFAGTLCGCPRLSNATKIYLGCCFGGSRRIATVLMSACDLIGNVSGAPCVLSTHQAPLAFHAFLFLTGQSLDDDTVSSSIGQIIRSSFRVHSRHEMDTEIAMHRFLQFNELAPALFPQSMTWRDVDEADVTETSSEDGS